jgi:hypothetical protein
MATEVTVEVTANYLAMTLKKDPDRRHDLVALNHVQGLFADWQALDLVEPSTRKHSVKDTEEYWSLTTFGVEVNKALRRQKLQRRADEALGVATRKAAAKKVAAKKTAREAAAPPPGGEAAP